jgi:hypothetical protein
MITSVGWCAGRPADHGVTDETDVAALQMAANPGTTALRDFRTGAPSVGWWSTQTMAAAAIAAVRPRQFDVAFSWTRVAGHPVRPVLDSAPGWVNRIILVGVHEMHNPAKKYTPEQFTKDMEWIRSEVPDGMHDRVVVAPCFIYYRSRISAPSETQAYLAPLLSGGLIDAVMWDGYPSNPADVGKPGGPTNPAVYEPAVSFVQHAREWMVETNLPYGWLELNFARRVDDPDGRRRAAWFGGMYRQTRADGGITVCQFHHNLGDLLTEPGTAEDDAWAALCRESEAAQLAYGEGHAAAQFDAVERYSAGLRAAYADVNAHVSGRLGSINGIDRL